MIFCVANKYFIFVTAFSKTQLFSNFVGKLTVEPQEQRYILLGKFTNKRPAKGFSIQVEPKPDPAESVETLITPLGSEKRYSLTLHVANYGNKAVSVEVWRM